MGEQGDGPGRVWRAVLAAAAVGGLGLLATRRADDDDIAVRPAGPAEAPSSRPEPVKALPLAIGLLGLACVAVWWNRNGPRAAGFVVGAGIVPMALAELAKLADQGRWASRHARGVAAVRSVPVGLVVALTALVLADGLFSHPDTSAFPTPVPPSQVVVEPPSTMPPAVEPAPLQAAKPATAVTTHQASPRLAVAVLPQTLCKNEPLGYYIVTPAGWHDVVPPPGDGVSRCQAFNPDSVKRATETDPRQAAVYFTTTTRTPEDVAGTSPGRVDMATVAGMHGLKVEEVAVNGSKVVESVTTYLLPLVRRTLVVQLATFGSSARVHNAGRQALAAMLLSLKLIPSSCQNSTDPVCGAFFWAVEPGQNATLDIVSPPTTLVAHLNQPLTLTLNALDPDANTITVISENWGDVLGYVISRSPLGLDTTLFRLRDAIDEPGDAHGGWWPPTERSGITSVTLRKTYTTAGTYNAHFTLKSSNSKSPPGHDDPFASYAEVKIDVTVVP